MFMREVELLPDYGQSQQGRHIYVRSKTNPIKYLIKSGHLEKIGKVKGRTVYLDRHDSTGYNSNSRFYAVNDENGQVDMTVSGMMKKTGKAETFKIDVLSGRKGSNLKAYEFYRLIMLKMLIIFVTDTQSYGGMRTWQELSRYPDIEVFGWLKGKAVNVDPRDSDETHASVDDVRIGGIEPEARDIKNMKLVAHRKIKGRGR